MNHRHLLLLLALMGVNGLSVGAQTSAEKQLQSVDPFIGTGFHGHTFPGATTPFGMVQLSPDTRTSGWQWTWFVPHDVPELMELFGGREPFARKLNDLFTTSSALTGKEISGDITGLIGQYAHGNEPSHHIAYLFNWAEQPWRTAEIVSQIMTEFYQAAPAGLIGNEDCGQMSAWFVLSSMGIYQVCPGDPNFSLGCPLFDEARVLLPSGKYFVVKRQNASAQNKYVQQVTLDGQPLKSPFITYADIMAGMASRLNFNFVKRPAIGIESRRRNFSLL